MQKEQPQSPPQAPEVSILYLPGHQDLPPLAYQSVGAAGADIAAACPSSAPVTLQPGERQLIPAGFCLELPEGYEAQIRPRSGLALKHGLTVLNSPGTVDADYRGEIKVLLINLGAEPFTIRRGARIAQLVIAPAPQARFVNVKTLATTPRGQQGFGSTGTE